MTKSDVRDAIWKMMSDLGSDPTISDDDWFNESLPVRCLAELRGLRVVHELVDDQTRVIVSTARTSGASWADVGTALGISRQAAQQRFGH